MKTAAITVWAAFALMACVSAPPMDRSGTEALLADDLFRAPAKAVRSEAVFELSPAMREYLAGPIAGLASRRGPRVGLMEALRKHLSIEYDAAMTRNAAEAFAARSGNCLSLVLMTAAFAREMQIPVEYRSVYGQDTWTRVGGINFHTGHVNLVLGTRAPGPLAQKREPDENMIVDFLPSSLASRLYARPISEATVIAMYFNNRAAEVLLKGDVDQAYWLVRESLRTDPSFTSAYNTLGVVYRRHGNLAESERALRVALQREPGNAQVLSNLVAVVAARGRDAEAAELRQQLAAIMREPPFHYFDLGMAALKRGDNQVALELFDKELARMPYDGELHFLAAIASVRQGELRRARRHLTRAVQNSETPDRRQLYSAKLDHLKSLSVN